MLLVKYQIYQQGLHLGQPGEPKNSLIWMKFGTLVP